MKLIALPGKTEDFHQEFVLNHKDACALDGYCISPPAYDPVSRCANFDHHSGVNRLATRCTAAQVALAIRQGYLEWARPKEIYVNDRDQDVCLSVFLLRHPEVVEGAVAFGPLLNKLLYMEDLLDSTGGLVRVPFSYLLSANWIFEPYIQTRSLPLTPELIETTIQDVELRIQQYLAGKGLELSLGGAVNILEQVRMPNGTLALIKEVDYRARGDYAALGIDAFVLTSGPGTISLGKLSPFSPINLASWYEKLNKVEPGWGGSDLIGGSPRKIGTKLTHDQVFQLIQEVEGVD